MLKRPTSIVLALFATAVAFAQKVPVGSYVTFGTPHTTNHRVESISDGTGDYLIDTDINSNPIRTTLFKYNASKGRYERVIPLEGPGSGASPIDLKFGPPDTEGDGSQDMSLVNPDGTGERPVGSIVPIG